MGAFLAQQAVAAVMQPGDHGSPFGGNPVVAAAALAGLQVLEDEGLMANAAERGQSFQQGLQKLAGRHEAVRDVRGRGLMQGMELAVGGRAVVDECFRRGLLINCTAGKVLRFLPPMTITDADVDAALAILDAALAVADAEVRQENQADAIV